MTITKIDDRFAKSPQIQPHDLGRIAAAGYKGIVCARPDNEDPDQPAFASIAAAAAPLGLKAYHIPVSGPLTAEQLIRFEQAQSEIDGPILGYCRSGARASSLYAATR